jgi:hypothetical protein
MHTAARLTDDQLATIRSTITAGGTRDQAAEAAGIARSLLDRHLRDGQLVDLRGGTRWRPRAPDPTPLELRARAAEVRARWTADRWVGRGAGQEGDDGHRR